MTKTTIKGKGNWRTSAEATRLKNLRLEAEAQRINARRSMQLTKGDITICPSFPIKPLRMQAPPYRRPLIDAPGCTVRSIDGDLQ